MNKVQFGACKKCSKVNIFGKKCCNETIKANVIVQGNWAMRPKDPRCTGTWHNKYAYYVKNNFKDPNIKAKQMRIKQMQVNNERKYNNALQVKACLKALMEHRDKMIKYYHYKVEKEIKTLYLNKLKICKLMVSRTGLSMILKLSN